MWQDLYDIFHQTNGPKVSQLKQSISNLQKGELDVTTYFTNLKAHWEELSDFRPITVCVYGGSKETSYYQHQDYLLHFLVGLNESYTHVRAQILMMNPLPLIDKAFSLVIQEDKQCGLPFMTIPIPAPVNGNKNYPKKPLLCTHFGLHNHNKDQCYKLHDFPLGWKPKFKDGTTKNNNNGSVSHISETPAPSAPFTPAQCQQLMTFLANQLQA
ncbi:uncharacterized protein LOC133779235 [Humulus lupulus]|uniref:uncharacterized protein LOC133779235 n=1 Tax=Humulus lupulus TaxID=3486 RepID=UPI002B40EAC1|nr:uncharacterized protein LOC133779235 [Humulus lupulus]